MWLFLLPPLVIVCAIAMGFWAKASINRADAARHAIPRCPIANIADGTRVRIVGKARSAGQELKAPDTGRSCFAYKSEIHAGGDVDAPPPLHSIVPFLVEDETGGIAVEVDHVKFDLASARVPIDGPSHPFGASIIARNLDPDAKDGASSVTYEEAVLAPDARVAVTGVARRGPDGTLRISGTAQAPVVISTESAALER